MFPSRASSIFGSLWTLESAGAGVLIGQVAGCGEFTGGDAQATLTRFAGNSIVPRQNFSIHVVWYDRNRPEPRVRFP